MKRSVDHTGREFRSLSAMAAAWGQSPNNVRIRLGLGWPLEKALTAPFRGGDGKLERMIKAARQRAERGLCDDVSRQEWYSIARWLEELRARRNKEHLVGGDDGAPV